MAVVFRLTFGGFGVLASKGLVWHNSCFGFLQCFGIFFLSKKPTTSYARGSKTKCCLEEGGAGMENVTSNWKSYPQLMSTGSLPVMKSLTHSYTKVVLPFLFRRHYLLLRRRRAGWHCIPYIIA